MEVFAASSAIFGTLVPAAEAIALVIKLCRDWKDIPTEVERARDELARAGNVLGLIEKAEEGEIGKHSPVEVRRLMLACANQIYQDTELLRNLSKGVKPTTAWEKSKYLRAKPEREKVQQRLSRNTAVLADCVQVCLNFNILHENEATFRELEAARRDIMHIAPGVAELNRKYSAIEQKLDTNESMIRGFITTFEEERIPSGKIGAIEDDVSLLTLSQNGPIALSGARDEICRLPRKEYQSWSLSLLHISRCWDNFEAIYSFDVRIPLYSGLETRLTFSLRTQARWSYLRNIKIGSSFGLVRKVNCSSELWRACLEGDLKKVHFLLEVEQQDPFCVLNKKVLDKASGRKVLPAKHRGGPDTCCVKFVDGDTLLAPAVLSKNRALVRHLLRVGISANEKNELQRNVLFLAFNLGLVDIARDLVNRGAALDEPDLHGNNVLNSLIKNTRSPSSTHNDPWAPAMVDEEQAMKLLQFLVDEQFPYFGGSSPECPLEQTARKGLTSMFSRLSQLTQTLKNRGQAIVNMLDVFQQAALGACPPIMRHILASHPGLDVTYGGFCGEPILVTLTNRWEANDLETLELFLKKRIDPNLKGMRGRTALHHAAALGAPDSWLQKLFEYGAQANVTNCRGETPLHEAAAVSNTIAVRRLLAMDADVNATSVTGHTPLHMVVTLLWDGHSDRYARGAGIDRTMETLQLLLDAGADPLSKSKLESSDIKRAFSKPDPETRLADAPSDLLFWEEDFDSYTPGELAQAQPDSCLANALYTSAVYRYMESRGKQDEVYIDREGDLFWSPRTSFGSLSDQY